MTPRVRAPRLRGAGGWLNTDGRDLDLAALRGRIVVLDFWTSCCVNCLHAIAELRPVEERFADVLTVIGVHSPKFDHERDHATVTAAVERYGITHPVLDDPDLRTWQQYAARAWPTLVVVDPEGYVVATMTGAGHAEGLTRLVEALVIEHAGRGTLRRAGSVAAARPMPASPLRFPGKVVALPDGDLLVSDTAHHRLVRLAPDDDTVLAAIGTGQRGRADGLAPTFAEPQGVALLPPDVAAAVGYDVVVADTANHLLRGLRLADGRVRTLAGSGRPWRAGSGTADLSSPWDVTWWQDRIVVAMAGIHQLWSLDLRTGDLAVLAGTTVEGLRDGPAAQAWLAQPSGLAAADDRLWFVDAETSALRFLDAAGVVGTAVGEGLFDFGHVDGPAGGARLQHPLGVALLPDGSIAICDTYNDAVRRYDPVTDEVSTLADGVAEPSGAALVDGQLVVVESAAHRLIRSVTPGATRRSFGTARPPARPPTLLRPGPLRLRVEFTPPAGQRLDHSDGPATGLEVTATPAGLLRSGAGAGDDLARDVSLDPSYGLGVLQVTARAVTCDHGGAHPACHLSRQAWEVPVVVADDGAASLTLVLPPAT